MIRVLIVDDSAFMRKAVSRMFDGEPDIRVVATARDGEEGIRLIKEHRPDIVTLDIEMPRMGGLEALKIIMDEIPTPVIIISSLTEEGARVTLDAMELGAVDFMPKNLTTALDIVKIRDELVKKVRAVAGKRLARIKAERGVSHETVHRLSIPKGHIPEGSRKTIQKAAVVVIGISTGGPKALQEVLPLFPPDFPAAILVVQHMPKAFTGPFAERMNDLCSLSVKEAEEGDVVSAGEILIAPGGIHMKVVRRKSTEVEIALTKEPVDYLYKPSVDVTMLSVADVYPGRSIGVIMTGMGADGVKGMLAIKEKHGRTIAQDEATSIIYGMPKAAVDAGVADKVVSLDKITGEIINMV